MIEEYSLPLTLADWPKQILLVNDSVVRIKILQVQRGDHLSLMVHIEIAQRLIRQQYP